MTKGTNLPKYKNFQHASRENSKLYCSARGCTEKRRNISRYCRKHEHQNQQQGHPEATWIRKTDFETERELVQEIIDKNSDHPGVQHAVKFLDGYLKAASTGSANVPAPDHMASLYLQGVTGKELLVTIAAIYLLYRGRTRLIKSDRHMLFAVGNAVLRTRKLGMRTYGRQRREIGKLINKTIGVLCLNICRTIEVNELKKLETYNKQTKPLVTQ